MWYLIFITLIDAPEPRSVLIDSYESMTLCFHARESLSVDLGSRTGYYPEGTNALCIYKP